MDARMKIYVNCQKKYITTTPTKRCVMVLLSGQYVCLCVCTIFRTLRKVDARPNHVKLVCTRYYSFSW